MKFTTILFFTCLSFTTFSQDNSDYGFYLDANFGLFPVAEDVMHGFNLSAGHRFTKNIGVGLALNRAGEVTLDTRRSVFGISIEPRLTFNRFLVKLNGGMLMNVNYFDGYCNGEETGDTNFYFSPSAEYRLGAFTLGLSTMFAPNLVLNLSDSNPDEPSGFCDSTTLYHLPNYQSRFLFISIGLSFPRYVRE